MKRKEMDSKQLFELLLKRYHNWKAAKTVSWMRIMHLKMLTKKKESFWLRVMVEAHLTRSIL